MYDYGLGELCPFGHMDIWKGFNRLRGNHEAGGSTARSGLLGLETVEKRKSIFARRRACCLAELFLFWGIFFNDILIQIDVGVGIEQCTSGMYRDG